MLVIGAPRACAYLRKEPFSDLAVQAWDRRLCVCLHLCHHRSISIRLPLLNPSVTGGRNDSQRAIEVAKLLRTIGFVTARRERARAERRRSIVCSIEEKCERIWSDDVVRASASLGGCGARWIGLA